VHSECNLEEATMKMKRIGGFSGVLQWRMLVAGLLMTAGCGGGSRHLQGLSIITTSLPDGTIGSAYSQTIQATGGVAPFTWSVTSGALPHNLALPGSAGNSVTISGTPDRVQSSVAFTIQVADANGQSGKQPFTVNIQSSPTIAVTQSGAVQGVVEGNILAFRGIPYAAPPVGTLRWRPPTAPAMWNGIRDASAFGNLCPQLDSNNQPAGNEDCLVLNVFIGQPAQAQKQPVMVFFHGGGNIQGGTHGHPFDTPPLATKGAIVVTAEYRLGILGFFASSLLTAEDGVSSGNYALLDQIAALTWVQQNIAAFGGDTTHVMAFGQSAGSIDVQVLLASPLAKGLFSAAGMESNAGLHGLLTLAQLETLNQPVVSSLGCGAAADALVCLRAVPVNTILSVQSAAPIHFAIQTPALPLDPFDVLQQHGSPVPLLIGSTREEAAGFGDDPTIVLTPAQYATVVHSEFDSFSIAVADQVLALYPAGAYDTPAYALIAVDSDFAITFPTRQLARAAAGANRPPVWRYLFVHRFENDVALNAFRAFHRAELFFVFGNLQTAPVPTGYTPTPAELTLADQLMGYWTNFAATGDPNGSGLTQWPRYDATSDNMLQLDDVQTVINGYHNAECDYFATLP
jgi:para-nitrobenzyl esterase